MLVKYTELPRLMRVREYIYSTAELILRSWGCIYVLVKICSSIALAIYGEISGRSKDTVKRFHIFWNCSMFSGTVPFSLEQIHIF